MDLRAEAFSLFEFTCAMRRDLHRHPELGFREVRTAGIIAAELNALGMEVTTGVGKTGVVALLEGAQPGKCVLARFDMDALPVTEQTGADYASLTPGVMHACGHDGHVAAGLTVARLLAAHRDELAGSVKFVFQPAEEGLGGAESMIADGVLQDPIPDAALALHLWNEIPIGMLVVNPGALMAGAETFKVMVTGRGGHGGLPQAAADPIVAAAQVVTALQTVVSRNVSPLEAAVVSVTRIAGGETYNVIPPAVELQGTIRTYDPSVRLTVLRRFEQIVRATAEAMGCQAEIELTHISPAVVNNPGVAEKVQAAARRIAPDWLLDTVYRATVSEDMAFILDRVPGCYFLVGSANHELGLDFGHHHPRFDFDEDALPVAAALMAASIVELLS